MATTDIFWTSVMILNLYTEGYYNTEADVYFNEEKYNDLIKDL